MTTSCTSAVGFIISNSGSFSGGLVVYLNIPLRPGRGCERAPIGNGCTMAVIATEKKWFVEGRKPPRKLIQYITKDHNSEQVWKVAKAEQEQRKRSGLSFGLYLMLSFDRGRSNRERLHQHGVHQPPSRRMSSVLHVLVVRTIFTSTSPMTREKGFWLERQRRKPKDEGIALQGQRALMTTGGYGDHRGPSCGQWSPPICPCYPSTLVKA